MAMNNMQDQAVQNTGAMADRLAGKTDSWAALGVYRSGHGGREPARTGIGRTSQGGRADAHAGRRPFLCHRMCCGPDTLLCTLLPVFRTKNMVGNDEYVSFLPQIGMEEEKDPMASK